MMEEKIDGEALRLAMRHVPSPVTIVTVGTDAERRGITIGSFTSTSLHPPLISFNVSRESRIHDLITEAEHFAVHVLSDEQAHLSDRFATPDLTGEAQFRGAMYDLDEHGTPILEGALTVIVCRRHAVYEAGDHSIILGRVVELLPLDEDGLPLVYFDRGYRRVGKEAQPTIFDPVIEEG